MAKLTQSQKQTLEALAIAMETVTSISMTEERFKATYSITRKKARLNHIKMLRDFVESN